MANSNNECPTEILIDLKEDFVPSHINYKEIQTPLDIRNPMKYLENKETDCFEIKQEKYQCIMDMSPFRLKKECRDPVVITNSVQVLGAVEDCPTAVLIEVPNSSSMCPKQNSILNCNKSSCYQEDRVVKCKSLVQDTKEQEYICLSKKECGSNFSVSVDSTTEDSDNRYDCQKNCNEAIKNAMKNELSPPRLHWKTPSPKSMSRISKEASKIIHNLNSSALLDEDSLLCEEMLPIPINFDYFDLDEDSDQKNSILRTENSGADRLSDHKLSVSIQTEEEVISTEMISKEASNISSSSVIKKCFNSPEYQNFLHQSSSESFGSQMNLKGGENSNECNNASEELKQPEMQCGSLDNSEIFLCNEMADDVFTESNLPSEDKENILEREEKEILPSKTLNGCKAAEKISSVSKKEMKNRGTLRNLLNVKHTIESRNLLNANKINVTQQHYKVNSKELLYRGKQQLKKTTSVEPQTTPKVISRSNSYQYDSTRKSISSFHKPDSVKQKASLLSEYKSSSSDVKHAFMEIKTPSRRYSVATPLRNASTKKTALTPALPSFQNPSIPRFTPQSVGGNRFSFSKSCQQSNNASNSKGFKYQNFMSTSSAVVKPSFSRINSSKSDKKALNQNISMLSFQTSKNNSVSASNKKRFSSKLNLSSSLHAEQDRKLARALFPSMPLK